MDESPGNSYQSSARWTLILFVLATVLLVCSVVLPAGQSERVLGLLDDDERIVEPLRRLTVEFTSGVADESAELQRFLITGDSSALAPYRTARTRNDRRLGAMSQLAARLDVPLTAKVDSIARLVDGWRRLFHVGPDGRFVAVRDAARSAGREDARDSIVLAAARVEAALAEESARGRAAVTAHERLGVIINALLVLVAFGALVGVFDLIRRERRRARRESALRLRAEALSHDKLRLLEDAEAARARLVRVMDSRSRLMRGFSHDVKNPLGAADGYAALLEDGVYGAVTAEQRSSISRVRQAIHTALSLIDDLHELARAETGHLDIQIDRTNMSELLLATGDAYRAAARGKGLAFLVQIDADLPIVDTDASRVRQIVANLLSNAIKYTDTGSVTLRARSDAAHLFIDVEDTGPGIPADKQSIIFDEFTRIEKEKHNGVGIGLAISKYVAQALGCHLQLSSEVGNGAVFTLCIPRRAGGHAELPAEVRADQLISADEKAAAG